MYNDAAATRNKDGHGAIREPVVRSHGYAARGEYDVRAPRQTIRAYAGGQHIASAILF